MASIIVVSFIYSPDNSPPLLLPSEKYGCGVGSVQVHWCPFFYGAIDHQLSYSGGLKLNEKFKVNVKNQTINWFGKL